MIYDFLEVLKLGKASKKMKGRSFELESAQWICDGFRMARQKIALAFYPDYKYQNMMLKST